MPRAPRCVLALILGALLLIPAVVRAQAAAGSPPAPGLNGMAAQGAAIRAADAAVLAQAQTDLQRILHDSAQSGDDAALGVLRTQALALQARTEQVVATETPRLATVTGYLAQLGPPPKPPATETPPVRQLRAALGKARDGSDSLVKQGRLLTVAAGQAAERIALRRRTLFNERLFLRAPSPFSPQLWDDIGQNLPRDAARLGRMGGQAWTTARKAADPVNLGAVAAVAALAVLLLGPGRLWAEALGRRRAEKPDVAPTRLRRSGLALWLVLAGTVVPALAAGALQAALQGSGLPSPQALELLETVAALVVWIAFLTALGRALLSPSRPAWRLAPISDLMARRMTPYPWMVAAVTSAGSLVERINSLGGASLAATVAANCAISLAYAGVAGAGLWMVGRARLREGRALDEDAGSPLRSLVAVAVGLATTVAFVAALLGYFALAYLIARQMIWIGILAAVLYVLLPFIDDALTEAVSPGTQIGRRLRAFLGLKPGTVEQLGVLASALARVALLLLALAAALAPFGTGAVEMLGRFGTLATGFKLGGATISPLALIGGVASFLVGLALVRAVQRWLTERYLPKTDWDAGLRNSVATGVGYLGMVVAVAWGLAAMGLGLQRIALIASALSVGIGFGLQAIVSNFISGLILLAERPVKVGDWVAVGDQEGDVRRINVRATEITLFDRSTLIVPNSEFVTKTVRNVTLGDTPGRVAIRLVLAPSADPARARDLVAEAFKAEPAILDDPAPAVFLDAVTETGIVLNSFSYVASPRAAYPTRSALLFDILARFRAAGVELASSQAQVSVRLEGAGESRDGPAPPAPLPRS